MGTDEDKVETKNCSKLNKSPASYMQGFNIINMTKIAIPFADGQLNGQFGHTQQFYIFKTENNLIVEEEILAPPLHEPELYPKWLAEMGVTDVIADGMGRKAIALFNQKKIHVFIGVAIKPPKELVMDFLNGALETCDNTCSH